MPVSPELGTAAIVTAAVTAFGLALRYIVPAIVAMFAMRHGREIKIKSGLRGIAIDSAPPEEEKTSDRI